VVERAALASVPFGFVLVRVRVPLWAVNTASMATLAYVPDKDFLLVYKSPQLLHVSY